jgi:hypothetical protein
VWINVMGISPTITVSPLAWATRWSAVTHGGAGHPLDLVGLHVDRHLGQLEQLGDADDLGHAAEDPPTWSAW